VYVLVTDHCIPTLTINAILLMKWRQSPPCEHVQTSRLFIYAGYWLKVAD